MYRHPLSDVLNHKNDNFRRLGLKVKIKDNKNKKICNYYKDLAFNVRILQKKLWCI